MRSSVALRLIFAAMPESVMFSSMRMTFLCADISFVETLTGPRRIGCMPGRPRPPMAAATHHAAGPTLLAGAHARASDVGACARIVLNAALHRARGTATDAGARCVHRRRHRDARTAGPVLDAGLRRRGRARRSGRLGLDDGTRRSLGGRAATCSDGGGGGRRSRVRRRLDDRRGDDVRASTTGADATARPRERPSTATARRRGARRRREPRRTAEPAEAWRTAAARGPCARRRAPAARPLRPRWTSLRTPRAVLGRSRTDGGAGGTATSRARRGRAAAILGDLAERHAPSALAIGHHVGLREGARSSAGSFAICVTSRRDATSSWRADSRGSSGSAMRRRDGAGPGVVPARLRDRATLEDGTRRHGGCAPRRRRASSASRGCASGARPRPRRRTTCGSARRSHRSTGTAPPPPSGRGSAASRLRRHGPCSSILRRPPCFAPSCAPRTAAP